MGKAPGTSANDLIGKLKKDLGDIAAEARNATLTPHGRRKLTVEIEHAAHELNGLLAELDPIVLPKATF